MKLTVPHMGLLSNAYTNVLRKHGVDMRPPPRPSINTLNIGVKYSPEFACLPFKINIGNMIEALEKGVDSILMPGGYGPCRFGYYSIIQEQILRRLGYEFKMARTDNPDSLSDIVKTIRDISDINTKWDGYSVFYLILMRMALFDRIEAMYFKTKPREINTNEADKVFSESIRIVEDATSFLKLFKAWNKVRGLFKDVRTDKKAQLLRVGILGEIFVIIEPFANMDVERRLARMGVEVIRGVWLSDWLNDRFRFKPFKPNQNKLSRKWAYPYLKYPSGGESIESVGKTLKFYKQKIDGVVHIMPFTCMPELVASTILHRISADLNYPILSLTFDEHVSEANIQTRLEAFVDLLERKKKKRDVKEIRYAGISWH
ncbi:MAG: CoA protein activase [Nitrospirota bacterium]